MVRVAAVLAINRLCAPGSELAIERPLVSLHGVGRSVAHRERQDQRHEAVSLPGSSPATKAQDRTTFEAALGELFQAEFDVLLYDLTSTYVEGAAEANPMMRRGYSRDHRPDCEQLVLALIVNQDGFPFSYELFDGNRADVSTVETILRTVERKHGKARRVWIFDRGVVSEENLVAIRKRGGQYLVGTARSKLLLALSPPYLCEPFGHGRSGFAYSAGANGAQEYSDDGALFPSHAEAHSGRC